MLRVFRDPQVILFSKDVERLAAFYADLGFVETFRVPQEGPPIHVDMVLGNYKIGFASVDSTREDHGLDPVVDGQRAAVILWTDDVETAYETMTANGCPALEGPHTWLDRVKIAWLADPDGHPVQIVQSL